MNIDSSIRILDAITKLIGIIVWPAPPENRRPPIESHKEDSGALLFHCDSNRIAVVVEEVCVSTVDANNRMLPAACEWRSH